MRQTSSKTDIDHKVIKKSERKMMKKIFLLVLTLVVIGSLILSGCSSKSTSTATSGSGKPVSGGTLRVLSATGVSNLSYVAGQGMTDETMAKAYAETLVYYSATGDFKPELAKSWKIDEAAKTLTFNLEKGVKFQDGTPFNAEAVKWNVQNLIDSKRLANSQYVDSIEVVDDYTFRYHLNGLMTPSMMLHSYGYNLLTMFSPTAFNTNGGKDWATSHFVSTGAFKFDSWTQDVSLKITRFDDYWRGGDYPYLDAIEFIFVADATIAKAKMEAGEADAWSGPALKEGTDLEKAGFSLNVGIGGFYSDIIPNNVSEGSPFKDQKVREALEYALDRDALASGLGYGKLSAVKQTGGPASSQGYNKDFKVREHNVQTAKDLLAQAGYPTGIKTKMMVFTSAANDMATAIQANLGEAGITVEIDVADPGRYIGALYAGGWDGLLLWSCPIDPEFAIGWFVHFGPQAIFPYPSLAWPDAYRALVEKVRLAPSLDSMRAATKDMMTFVSEGAYIIPLIDALNLNVTKAGVHSQMGKEHFMTWHNYMDWIAK
jgi:peptide/nickel transport system substrate-binding protein